MTRAHRTLNWKTLSRFVLAGVMFWFLAFLATSSIISAPPTDEPAQSAPNSTINKKLKLNDRLTVKGQGCKLQIKSQANKKMVIRCKPTKEPPEADKSPDSKSTIKLKPNDLLKIKGVKCYLQAASPSKQRMVIDCLSTLPPIIPPTTNVLTDDTTQYLSSVSTDGATFTFSQTTDQLNALAAGEVMVGDPSDAAPYGFLRKVESVSNNGGQVVVQTEATTIEEAVKQGEVSISQVLQPTNPERAILAKGVRLIERPDAPDSFYIQLDDVVLYDDDGNENTTNDQIRGNGSISVEPSFDFKLKVQDSQLKELYFTTTSNVTTRFKIGSQFFGTVKAEKVLASFPQGPLLVTIGPFPVWLYPVITINAGVDGTIHAGVSTNVTQTLTETAGASFANGTWSPIQQFCCSAALL